MNQRIVSVATEILNDPNNPQLLVHVTAEDGATGTGETWWGTYQPDAKPGSPVAPIASMVRDVLASRCVGWDSADIRGLWDELYRATYQYGPEGITSSAIAGIDLALWDLNARRSGVPVAEMLGDKVHDRLPAYASLDWLGNIERACEDAERAVQAGFTGVKLHEAAADIVLAVRDTIGPDVALMVDISARLDVTSTIEFAKAVESADLAWLEEPIFPHQDHGRLAEIQGAIAQRLAAGENEFSMAGLRRLLELGQIAVLQPDIVKFGGLTMASAIAELADEHQSWLCPHNFSLGPSLAANIHWSMTSPAANWIEVPFLSQDKSFIGGWQIPTLIDGCIAYPTQPGLGWS
jgi:D-galactarolactone cycloisomerase